MNTESNQANSPLNDPYRELFHGFLENLHDGISLTERDGTVIIWNKGMERITGFAANKAIGAKIWNLLSPLRPQKRPGLAGERIWHDMLGALLPNAQRQTIRNKEYIQRSDGEWRNVDIFWTPLSHRNRCVVGCIVRDVTECQLLHTTVAAQKNRAQTFLRITSRLNSNRNLPEALYTACQEVARLFAARMVTFCLYDETRRGFYRVSGYGLPDGLNGNMPLIPQRYYAKARTRKTVVQIRDIQRCKGLPDAGLLKELGIRNVITTGISYRGTLLGMLNIYRQGSGRASHPDDVDFLTSLSVKAGMAIFSARQSEREKKLRQQLRQLNKRILNIQEEERRRISRELHDQAGQALTVLKFSLSLMRKRSGKSCGPTDWGLDGAIELVNSIFEQIHFLVRDLRPPDLEEMEIHSAFADYCSNFTRRTGIPVHYQGVPLPGLTDSTGVGLYRLLQEALANIAKHARAANVRVRLGRKNHLIELSVSDDGRGFRPAESNGTKTKGIGIVGMKERVAMLNGEFSIHSILGQGTTVTAVVPWRVRNDSGADCR